MGLKTLIVDDEPVAREVLREELESISGVEVVAEADNGAAALEQITGQPGPRAAGSPDAQDGRL